MAAMICRMLLPPDGLYYFETEMPGDESVVGWGAVRFYVLSSASTSIPSENVTIHQYAKHMLLARTTSWAQYFGPMAVAFLL